MTLRPPETDETPTQPSLSQVVKEMQAISLRLNDLMGLAVTTRMKIADPDTLTGISADKIQAYNLGEASGLVAQAHRTCHQINGRLDRLYLEMQRTKELL